MIWQQCREERYPTDSDEETIGSLRVIREMVDHARDVDEAIAVLQSYNIVMQGDVPIRYLIDDRLGHSVLVEFHDQRQQVPQDPGLFRDDEPALQPDVHRRSPDDVISGIPMHHIRGIDPHRDTLQKVKTIALVVGPVLDTATGLGYTVIEAAKTAGHVATIGLDSAALEVARLNPWSQALFDNPRITHLIGDSFEDVQRFEDETLARIIHDPPAFSLVGDLHSG